MDNKKDIIEEKYILEYIRDMLNTYKLKKSIVDDESYHHNSRYSCGSSIIKNGILCLNDQNKRGIIKYSKEKLDLLGDINSHINGNDGISLSKVGLTDLYRDEDEYDPRTSYLLDFLISKSVNASRMTEHYGNEFICYSSIDPGVFESLDIRLIEYLEKSKNNVNQTKIKEIIDKYNYLIDMCNTMVNTKMNIPLREMSYKDNFDIDIGQMSNASKLVLK